MPQTLNNDRDIQNIRICDQFQFVGSRSFDNKFRVNLGQKIFKVLKETFPFRSFDIYISPEGYILLQPMNIIPSNELWTWKSQEIKKSFDRALEDIRQGRTTVVEDLDSFLDSL